MSKTKKLISEIEAMFGNTDIDDRVILELNRLEDENLKLKDFIYRSKKKEHYILLSCV